ncbi:DUF3553 domain-containing protein [Alphaproteobacteria bacterium]|nr:DUF3553 domain-containing protein [Alphaproteobacteria bacterium]
MVEENRMDLTPENYVINKNNNEWGVGQIQSSIDNKVTVNFENVGKKVINISEINLEVINYNDIS